ncbi:MAG TPA: 2-oxoacid:acceptor oxidoreductase subunit alpha [Gammaproteobacteria bacterium]|nr:2-oxoacid:acceptor oxidoreductase subunit alpha [Gammaproteobacteria bacterium]
MQPRSVSIAVTGSGGAGVMTAGKLLLDLAARAGWYGMMARSFGPQIRGGEAAALLRIASHPVQNPDDRYDVLLAIDWGNIGRFASEIPLHGNSLIIADPRRGAVPGILLGERPRVAEVPLADLARENPHGRANMVALGVLAALVGLAEDPARERIGQMLAGRGEDAVGGGLASLRSGFAAAAAVEDPPRPGAPPADAGERWNISGNEATGLGALHGGIRFVAAYPITPATDVLEWLAPRLPSLGGALVQAEDELAAINMCLGASYGGTPSLTATSGPGFSLMSEGLGLGVASETPVVVVDVMRGGPSTGIPTKSEQTDLEIAVYGLHGDAPHVVVAPTGIDDCLHATQWATGLAEALQTPAIVLSDQAMGQARAIIDRPAIDAAAASRRGASGPELAQYRRYAITDDGISPAAVPGTPGGEHTADGLEHDEYGTPSAQAGHHFAQLDKRRRKLALFDYGDRWADVEGDGELAVITWGSSTQVVREALDRAAGQGIRARLVALRLIAPALPERMAAALAGCRRVLVIEQNHDGQLHRYLRGHYHLPGEIHAWHHPGPLQIRPAEVLQQVLALAPRKQEAIG